MGKGRRVKTGMEERLRVGEKGREEGLTLGIRGRIKSGKAGRIGNKGVGKKRRIKGGKRVGLEEGTRGRGRIKDGERWKS